MAKSATAANLFAAPVEPVEVADSAETTTTTGNTDGPPTGATVSTSSEGEAADQAAGQRGGTGDTVIIDDILGKLDNLKYAEDLDSDKTKRAGSDFIASLSPEEREAYYDKLKARRGARIAQPSKVVVLETGEVADIDELAARQSSTGLQRPGVAARAREALADDIANQSVLLPNLPGYRQTTSSSVFPSMKDAPVRTRTGKLRTKEAARSKVLKERDALESEQKQIAVTVGRLRQELKDTQSQFQKLPVLGRVTPEGKLTAYRVPGVAEQVEADVRGIARGPRLVPKSDDKTLFQVGEGAKAFLPDTLQTALGADEPVSFGSKANEAVKLSERMQQLQGAIKEAESADRKAIGRLQVLKQALKITETPKVKEKK